MTKQSDSILHSLNLEFDRLMFDIKEYQNKIESLDRQINTNKSSQKTIESDIQLYKMTMNEEFQKLNQRRLDKNREWDSYKSLLERNNPEIDKLKSKADDLASHMKYLAEKSQYEYRFGDKSMAKYYSEQKNDTKRELGYLNFKIKSLCEENKQAKPASYKVDDWQFKDSKRRFEEAKLKGEQLRHEVKGLFQKRTKLISEIKELRSRIDEVKQRQRDRIAELRVSRAKREDEGALSLYKRMRINEDLLTYAGIREDKKRGIKEGVFYDRKNPDIEPHITQQYSDGYRYSWDNTSEGVKREHWTNNQLKNKKLRHNPPKDVLK